MELTTWQDVSFKLEGAESNPFNVIFVNPISEATESAMPLD